MIRTLRITLILNRQTIRPDLETEHGLSFLPGVGDQVQYAILVCELTEAP